jgi:hypothetical protein
MFPIFKRKKENANVPEWASFFKEHEYVEFLKSIEGYFGNKKIGYDLLDGILKLDTDDFGLNNLGLMNVAQVCKQDAPKNYKKMVSAHFDALIRAHQFDTGFKQIIDDYDKIQDYIGVRLYPIDYPAAIGKDLTIGKEFSEGIYAMLVFDLPDSIINIQPEQADKWNKTLDELFETGIQNIRHKYPLEISEQKFKEFNIWFVQGDHFFAPNIVFDLNNHSKLVGSKGSLIGIPHRHSVIIYPIENIKVVKAINQLIPTIYGMNEEGPGSISNNIFWYKDGHFQNLPYKIADKKLQFFPPQYFVELLHTLTE